MSPLQPRLYANDLDWRWSDAIRGSRCERGEDKAMGKKT
jgi:hypothetical protein